MALPYSHRFIGATVAANGTVTYTVPANLVAVVRSISITNRAASVTGALVGITSVGYFYTNPAVAANSSIQLDMRQVLNAGEQLIAYAFTNALDVVISGYLLSTSP